QLAAGAAVVQTPLPRRVDHRHRQLVAVGVGVVGQQIRSGSEHRRALCCGEGVVGGDGGGVGGRGCHGDGDVRDVSFLVVACFVLEGVGAGEAGIRGVAERAIGVQDDCSVGNAEAAVGEEYGVAVGVGVVGQQLGCGEGDGLVLAGGEGVVGG